jgi:hypothetical protein
MTKGKKKPKTRPQKTRGAPDAVDRPCGHGAQQCCAPTGLAAPCGVTRVAWRRSWDGRCWKVGLGGEEVEEGRGGIGCGHQVFTDEEGVEADAAEFDEVGVIVEAGFGHGEAVVGNVLDQFEGDFAVDG